MTIELRLRPVCFAELQVLVLAHQSACEGAVAVLHLRRRCKDRRIKISDTFRGPDRHVELNIRNSERDAPKALGIWLVDAHAIAPRAHRLDMVIVLAKAEFRTLE